VEFYFLAVVVLLALAVSDLVVGVSNDAVNFLNSSFGSRVAPRAVVMFIASMGMLAGVTFSSGMMEVARKGIFHPQFFTMPELMTVFLAVMLTDILLLDLFNTFGLPTSTTVSIVFELLGAAVAVSIIKVMRAGSGFSAVVKYINTSKALAIISGILLSVVVAFTVGALVQFLTRLIFTFDYQTRLKRYGALWGGVALAAIIYFILIKGAKGASFITPQTLQWIKHHTLTILSIAFVLCAILLQVLMVLFRTHILKVIVLVGTFALAMAFAANDLVNFIGVPLAGLSSYRAAEAASNPLSELMAALRQPVRSHTGILLLAGLIMVVTLWVSRKAKTVTRTEISLGRQEEGIERFEASPLSRAIVRMATSLSDGMSRVIPKRVRDSLNRRFDCTRGSLATAVDDGRERPSFDLLRAAVNLMVASVLISLGTSLKLPLSTTYVTFMVAMGSSFSDRAWGRDSAVYRVTGVLTVIGGWFFTAFMAFTVSALMAFAIFYWKAPAVLGILVLVIFLLFRNLRTHRKRESEHQELEVFNLRKVKDVRYAVDVSFDHTAIFLERISKDLEKAYCAVSQSDRLSLKLLRKETKKLELWANIIVANIFKALRLLEQSDVETSRQYDRVISALQEIAEAVRDIVLRAYTHVRNNHKPLLPEQLNELKRVKDCVRKRLDVTAAALAKRSPVPTESIEETRERMDLLMGELNSAQIERIRLETSKTRLSILFYGFLRDSLQIAEHTLQLLDVFRLFNERRNKDSAPKPPESSDSN